MSAADADLGQVARRLALALAMLVACHDAPAPRPPPASLADALAETSPGELDAWRMTLPEWQATVVAPYQAPVIYADYVRAFDAHAAVLAAELTAPGALATRAHFAGDPRLTLGQAEARWALPVQFASQVATRGDQPIDAVFVRAGDHWRALVGIDDIVGDRVAARDAACAQRVAQAGPEGRCTDIAWVVADAALRADDARFTHACALAASLCPVVHGSP